MELKPNKESGVNYEYQGKSTISKILIGVLFFVVCIGFFVWYIFKLCNDFIAFENNTIDLELPSIIYILYEIGGKYLALSAPVVLIIGCFWIISKGVQRILKKDY